VSLEDPVFVAACLDVLHPGPVRSVEKERVTAAGSIRSALEALH